MKKLIIFLILASCFILFSCNGNNDNSKKDEEEIVDPYNIVSYSYPYFDNGMSSIHPMHFTLEGATFDCQVEYGSFVYRERVVNKIFNSNEDILWFPRYIEADLVYEDMYDNKIDNTYMDVIIRMDDNIIGFLIIEMYQIERSLYKYETHTVKLFKEGDNYLDNISLEYTLSKLEEAKETKIDKTLEEIKSLVYFPYGNTFNSTIDSYVGIFFIFNLEGAKFECSTDRGSFISGNKTNQITVDSNSRLSWCPIYRDGSNKYEEMHDKNIKKAYIDIIIKMDGDIIGCAVIKIKYLGDHEYEAEFVSSYFSKIDEDYGTLTLDQVNKEIKKMKK